ncbi:hypothetical protein GMSM_38280 [Geomonas sp. Red276]
MSRTHHEEPSEPISQREIRTVFAGLMLALALAALDQNIVGTALPRIVSDLGGLAHLSWVVTAFMLTSTTTTPLYGKLSDMFGRKALFVVSIVVFLIGSCLCGLSSTMMQLVLFRGIQGLGAGGLIVLAQTTIADLVAPRDRGRYQGLFGAVFAFSSIAGPLLGGFITDALSWRWIFYVNLPVGALALALIAFGFRRPHRRVTHRVDYPGVLLLTGWTTTFLLLLTWGGVTYAWNSPVILALAAAATVFFWLLVWQERRAAEPVIPPQIFGNKVFLVSSLTLAFTFVALLGSSVFMPLHFQLVLGMSPSRAGLMMAPMTVGLIASSFLGGRLVSRTGRYKFLPVTGLAMAAAALLSVSRAASAGSSLVLLEASVTALGFGFGLVMPNLTVAIQNAVRPAEIGVATATAGFFRSLGGAFGVALAGALVSFQLQSEGVGSVNGGARSILEHGIQQIALLPPAQRELVISVYRHAISTTFLAAAGAALAAFCVVLLLPEVPLRRTTPGAAIEEAAERAERAEGAEPIPAEASGS